ncbi:MAG: DUF5652 family protein [Candidatus Moranbacteria bacterium]|nr:DUF5652 family protein [Candidatus Moranbacteria bacterium]
MNINSILNNFWILLPLIVWTLFWKGMALWKSARRGEMIWFIVLLILNTLGILEIIYIFIVARKRTTQTEPDAKIEDSKKKKII